jgi:mannose-6-phosphate isomerase-like protein (cupin superfamily)
MKTQKIRWSKVYESTEEELVRFLQVRGIRSSRWAAEAFDTSGPQSRDKDCTIWCAEGSLLVVVNGVSISLQPGDALHIPANTIYETNAGISGCVCYDSTRQRVS